MESVRTPKDWKSSPWRKAMWGGAAALLLAPAVAMQFTTEVQWDETDFLAMGLLFAAACGTVELGARASAHWAYRAGVALAALTVFLLIWINLAVGIIGSEDHPANQLFAGVIAVAAGGACLARFRAAGMARAMQAAAAAQLAVAVGVLATGAGMIFPITGMFMALWLGAAWLFGRAARG